MSSGYYYHYSKQVYQVMSRYSKASNSRRQQSFSWSDLGLHPSQLGEILGTKGSTIKGIGRAAGDGCNVYYQKKEQKFEISAWNNQAIQRAVLALKKFQKPKTSKKPKKPNQKPHQKPHQKSSSFAAMANMQAEEHLSSSVLLLQALARGWLVRNDEYLSRVRDFHAQHHQEMDSIQAQYAGKPNKGRRRAKKTTRQPKQTLQVGFYDEHSIAKTKHAKWLKHNPDKKPASPPPARKRSPIVPRNTESVFPSLPQRDGSSASPAPMGCWNTSNAQIKEPEVVLERLGKATEGATEEATEEVQGEWVGTVSTRSVPTCKPKGSLLMKHQRQTEEPNDAWSDDDWEEQDYDNWEPTFNPDEEDVDNVVFA